jgi:hypothetical protein
VFLYDFQVHKVFELSQVGMNFPPLFSGLAWLSNDLIITVGAIYVEATAAPSVTIYDFGSMNVRTLAGGFVRKDEYLKNQDDHVTVEPDLMLYYRR